VQKPQHKLDQLCPSDPGDYRQPIMTLLFIKRLNDTFEENADKLVQEGKSQKEDYENKKDIISSWLKKQDGLCFLQLSSIYPLNMVRSLPSRVVLTEPLPDHGDDNARDFIQAVGLGLLKASVLTS
jgi:HsdM-like protein